MSLVIRIDRLNRVGNLFDSRKPEQPFAVRQDVVEACLLGNDGLAGRKIVCAAIANPAGAQPYVLILCDGKFSARVGDVLAIVVHVSRKLQRVTHEPAFTFQCLLVCLVITATAQRKLKRLLCAFRYIEELQELIVLTPVINFTLKIDLAVTPQLLPVANCSKCPPHSIVMRLPEVKNDRLARGFEVEAI